MKIVFVGLIIAIVIVAFKTLGSVMAKITPGKITPGLGSNVVGQFKNITGNIGWLFAIGGQAFCLILIWQCFPEFFGHWLKTNGFWFIQLGFVVSVIMLKYAKPQVVGWVALLLTLVCLLVSMVSAGKRKSPTNTETIAVSIPKSATDRRWEYGWVKPPDVKGLVPSIRQERHKARIVYYDQFRFDIIIYLRENGTEAILSWDKVKNPDNGEWRQPNPENYGKWYLTPDSKTQPTSFNGWATNKKGETYPIWMKAVD